jgi:hypothetical protein
MEVAITMIKATVKGGRLELNVPADWPDGTEVEIHPLDDSTRGDAQVDAAAEIAKTLAALDRIEPFEMSDAEEAAWEAERRADREREKAHFAEHSERLRRMWD